MRSLRGRRVVGWAAIALAGCLSDTAGPGAGECTVEVALAPGDVAEAFAPATFCLSGPASATYAAVSFMEAEPGPAAPLRVLMSGDGHEPLEGTASGITSSPHRADSSPDRVASSWDRTAQSPDRGVPIEGVPLLGHPVLENPWTDRAARAGAAPAGASRSAPLNGPFSPGDTLQLDASPRCDTASPRSARVVSITEHAVVLTDVDNPEPGLTEQELVDFGVTFDGVYDYVTAMIGEPDDIDGNGRVGLFFTRGVNDQGIGGSSVVAGFFWSGDLASTQACSSSNRGEILYLAVPDPAGVGGVSISGDLVREITVSTMGHELQHLVNSSRRIFVTGSAVLEETWLNEALSLVVEELLFYRATPASSGSNLDDAIRNDPAFIEALRSFQLGNLGRYNLYLQSPRHFSPIGPDDLETRGAAWAFLRYALDRHPASEEDLLGALVNSSTAGLDNLSAVLGSDALAWMGDWSVAVLADDLVADLSPAFVQPSWNFRGIIPPLRPDNRFPLRLLEWPGESVFGFDLLPGSSAHVPFRAPSGRARVTVTAPGVTSERAVRTVLVRLD